MPKLVTIPLEHLYEHTLRNTSSFRPWACDKSGRFVSLQERYKFAELVIRRNYELSDNEIKSTGYWKLLNVKIEGCPRDGGATWVYKDPWAQVTRFLQLIQSLVDHGYATEEKSEVVIAFESAAPPHLELQDEKTVHVRYEDRSYQGLLVVEMFNGSYHCRNGNHRLAALSCMKDLGLFVASQLPVLLIDKDSASLPVVAYRRIRRFFWSLYR
jgi:hypothetical protein